MFLRTTFSKRGMKKIYGETIVETNGKESVESAVGDFAKLIDENDIKSGDAIKSPSVADFSGMSYIGYLIEKQRLDESTGLWKKIDEYKIIGALSDTYYDTRVAYGKGYRYRIKSLIKVTKPEEVLTSLDDVQQDPRKDDVEQFLSDIEKNKDVLKNITEYVNKGLSTQRGTTATNQKEGRSDKKMGGEATIPIGNFIINLVDNNMIVTKKATNTSIASINMMTNPTFLDGEVSQADLRNALNKELELKNIGDTGNTQGTIEYNSEYYYSKFQKGWSYILVTDKEIPPCPSYFMIYPDSKNKTMRIIWTAPDNKQKDIKYYQLRRRSSIKDGWMLLKKFDNTVYNWTDKYDMQFGRKYIYTISSIDVHGYESFLSIQVQVELNPKYITEKEEKPLKLINTAGARPDQYTQNLGHSVGTEIDIYSKVIKSSVELPPPIIAQKGILTFEANPNYDEDNRTFIIRVKSLDMHAKEEIKLVLKNVLINEKETKK